MSHKNIHVQCVPCQWSVFPSMCSHISTRPYTQTCTRHTCSSFVLLCSILFTSCLLVECLPPMPYISLQLVLIVHHMHHSACFTCYICPHIPCYMSALFSTCYLSGSTIQHIHQAYMNNHVHSERKNRTEKKERRITHYKIY